MRYTKEPATRREDFIGLRRSALEVVQLATNSRSALIVEQIDKTSVEEKDLRRMIICIHE